MKLQHHCAIKMIAVVLAFFLTLVTSSFKTTAGNLSSFEPNTVTVDAVTVINRYRTDKNIEFTIAGQKTLYSFTGNETYTMYLLNPYGYVILCDSTGAFSEGCYKPLNCYPYDVYSDAEYYYGGPGGYCEAVETSILYLPTGEVLAEETILETCLTVHQVELEMAQSAAMHSETSVAARNVSSEEYTSIYVAYHYFSTLMDFGDNVDGTCTTIAIAILLGYYDYYVNDDYVPEQYESGIGTNEAFHQLLNDYMYGDEPQGGMSISGAWSAINNYLNDQNVHGEFVRRNYAPTVVSYMLTALQSGIPIVAGMTTINNAPYDHTVLVYGVTYDENDPVNTAVFTYHMGWLANTEDEIVDYCERLAAASWFEESAYIDDYDESHETHYEAVDNQVHAVTCSSVGCRHSRIEEHNFEERWNLTARKHYLECTDCEYQEEHDVTITSVNGNDHEYVCADENCGAQGRGAHVFSRWVDQGAIYHSHECEICSYTEREPHQDYWNSQLGMCTRCRRRGAIGGIVSIPDSEPVVD